MESNSDKEMRNKLQGAELPFDPKAWEQMEAMLDEKKDRKGFFWWWFGGVAACLLLAGGMFGYHQFINSGATNAASTNQPVAQLNNTSTKINAAPLESSSIAFNKNTKPQETTTANSNTPDVRHNEANTTASQPLTHTKNQKNLKPLNGKIVTKIASNTKVNTAGKNRKAKNSTSKTGTTMAAENQMQSGSNSNISASGQAITSTGLAEQLAATNQSRYQFDPAYMNPVETGLLTTASTNDDPIVKKEEEDVNLKKLKKKVFNYSLGIMVNITGATLGAQPGMSSKDAFSHTPSYMVGLTHDFMFFKRFAITNSILFSQTFFRVFNPKNTYGLNLLSYSSSINELAIPIGLKGYVYSKPKLRVYLATGVINHIKLKETFTYQYYNNSLTSSTADLLPAQTMFTGGQANMMAGYSNSGSFNPTTYEFSINHGRRYYASLYATAGAEFILQRHFVLFAESLFYMSLEKAGIQDKYKYNLGLSGGFRYQF